MHVTFRKLLIFLIISFFLTSCGGFFKYSPARENPTKGEARAKKMLRKVEVLL